jgi:hypothetical protein
MMLGTVNVLQEYAEHQSILRFRECLPTAQVIDITNVTEYYFRHHWPDYEGLGRMTFPNIAPPWPCFFMEFRAPAQSPQDIREMTHIGLLFDATEISDQGESAPRWVVECWVVGERLDGRIDGPILGLCWSVQPDGLLQDDVRFLRFWWMGEGITDDVDFAGYTMIRTLWPAWLALSFLHCKNVTLTDQKASRGERRRAEKAGTKLPVVYKVLNIRPMQEILRREGHADKTGLKLALHICRGHFKDYSKHGLFGKYKGMFWWESHVRGSVKEGIVDKDYAVHPPVKEEATR